MLLLSIEFKATRTKSRTRRKKTFEYCTIQNKNLGTEQNCLYLVMSLVSSFRFSDNLGDRIVSYAVLVTSLFLVVFAKRGSFKLDLVKGVGLMRPSAMPIFSQPPQTVLNILFGFSQN